MNQLIRNMILEYRQDTHGLALIESALILPILLVLLFGLFDLGQAVVIDQKVTAAAYTASDLITRKTVIVQDDLENAVGGAKLVIDPYDRALLGVDIVGIRFDSDEEPVAIWRHTHNMTENPRLPDSAEGLGAEGEGLVAVTVIYTYKPWFSGLITGNIDMEETSYMRGRRSSVVKMGE